MPRLKPSGCRRPPESSPAAPRGRGASLRTCFLRRLPAALALLLLAALAAPAQAASLVSNIGQSDDSSISAGGFQDVAQAFTTGTSGATLTSIEIRLSTALGTVTGDGVPTMTLHSGDPRSAVVATLTRPSSIANAAANYTYTAPANTTLAASTTYFVVIEGSDFNTQVRTTDSDNEDSGGQTLWSVADSLRFRTASSTAAFSTSTAVATLIRVNGTTTTADTTAPAFASAAANGAALVITFDEDLAAAASLANSAFTVKKTASGGSEATVALSTSVAPVISGTTVTLTLGTALVSTDGSVKVTYTKPTTGSANKLADAASNETATFTDQTVTNNTPAAASCAAPSFGTRRNIWTGALTVADFTQTGAAAHGFNADNGALDDTTFTLGANNYEITFLAHLPNEGSIWFRLTTNLTTLERSMLKLHVCDVALDFSAAQHVDGQMAYLFSVASIDSIDWSSVDSRTLYLSLPANSAATGAPTITAPDTDPTTVGSTLTATTGDIADTDGLPTTFTYQWSRVDADGTSNKEAIAGATASTYVLAAADVGKKVTVALTFTDHLGSEETRTSAVYPSSDTIVAAGSVCAAPDFGTRRNIWTGSLTVGSAVGGTTGIVGFAGTTGALDDKTFSIGSSNHEIDVLAMDLRGAPSLRLVLSLKDANLTSAEQAALRLHVCNTATFDFSAATENSSRHSYTAAYSGAAWTSGSTLAVYLSLPANSAATGTPTITAPDTDPTTVGSTLTATTGDIADTDGLPTTFTYQWSRVDADGTSNKEDISGAMASTYVLAAADVGKKVTVALTFTDNLGSEETRASAVYPASGTIVAAVAVCAAPNFGTRRNIWTGAVTVEPILVSGSTVAYGFSTVFSPTVGALDDKTFSIGSSNHEIDEIGVHHTGFADADEGDLDFSLNAALTTGEKAALRLHVCNAAFDFNAATLSSTTQTYKFTTDLDWSGVSSRTLYLSLPANTAATGTPTITAPDTDPTTVGSTLTATAGDIADTDGLPGSFTYQWSRVDADGTSNREDIAGATASTYRLAAADVGKKVTVALTFTDTLGSEETRTSALYPSSDTIVAAGSAGVTLSRSDLTVDEGSTGTYTVVLNSQPTGEVTVTPSVTGDSDITVSPSTLTFTTTNWRAAQEVTVSAAEDDDKTADSATIAHAVAGADYASVIAAGVAVTVTDNEAGICGRTPQVRDAILAQISGVSNCALVTDAHLAAITGTLDLDDQGISALAAGDFAGLNSLTNLSLTSNALTRLPDGVFTGLSALRLLDLADNPLTALSDNVFAGLTALRHLSLTNNALPMLPDDVFAGLTALARLNLQNNALIMLPDNVFAGLTALARLNLQNNALTTLPDNVFDELTALTLLNLNNNGLIALPDDVFAGLTALADLGLSNNALTALPDDVFEPLTALTNLLLAGNPGAPFSPTAVALPDNGAVPLAGGTLTLDGSGSDGGPWGSNVFYVWALTSPASGVTVSFDNATSATPQVTVPALTGGAELVFTLTVTGRGGTTGIAAATDTATLIAPAALPAITIAAGATPVTEGTAAAFTLSRTGATTAALTVGVTVTETGDVVAAADKGAKSATFETGEATATLSVATVDDSIDAADSVVTATVATDSNSPATYTPGTPASATVTVTDNDTADTTAPTLVISGVPATSDAPFTATFTFSEDITGFVAGDISLVNATLSAFSATSATIYTALITPTADGTVTLDVAADVATDEAGNGNTAAPQASSSYTAPVAALPVVTIAADTTPVTEGTAAAFTLSRTGATTAALTVNLSVLETGTMVETVNKGAQQATFAAGAATATLSVTTLDDTADETDSVVTATLVADTDPATYTPGTPASVTVTVRDNDSAGVTISTPALSVAEGGSDTYTVVLTSQPTGEVTVTPSVTGDSDVTVSAALTFTTDNWNRAQEVTVSAAEDDDAENDSATIAHAVVGADYASVIVADVSVTVTDNDTADSTAPRVVSIKRALMPSPTNADSLSWRVTFSEAVQNVDAADFALSGTSATLMVISTSSVRDYIVTASGGDLPGLNGTVSLSLAAVQNIQDLAGNALARTRPTGTNNADYVIDNTAPTLTISGVPATSNVPFTATFTFSEDVTGFVAGDISLVNAALSAFSATSATVYTARVTPTANGTVTLDVAADVATDEAGNGNTAAPQASSSYTAPVAALPVVTIAADTTPVTEGTAAAFTLSRTGATTAALTVNLSVSETANMLASADRGEQQATFAAGAATAALSVATVDDRIDAADSVVTATVADDTFNPATYTQGTPASATVTVTDNDTRGVTVSTPTLSLDEDSTGTYTVVLNSQPTAEVTITPSVTGDSEVTVSSALTFTTDNWNTAQTVTVSAAEDGDTTDDSATIAHAVTGADYALVTAAEVSVTVADNDTADTTAPQVTSIVRQHPTTSPTNADSLRWRVRFSEAVENVDAADFVLSGTTATPTIAVVSASEYDITARGGNLAALDGTVTLSFAAAQNIQDAADNVLANTTPTGTNNADYVIDNTAPTLTIRGVPATSDAPFTAIFIFSEEVTSFTLDNNDITAGNATLSAFTANSARVYTARVTPTADGTVTLDVAANNAWDTAGNGNTAATRASSTYTAPPLPAIRILPDPSTVTEGTAASFSLIRSGAPITAPLTVTVTVSENGDVIATADEGVKQVTFEAGVASALLSVTTIDDAVVEDDSVVTATVVADTAVPATYTLSNPSTAMVTVRDNDTRGVTVSEFDLSVAEGGSDSYTIVLNSQPTAEVTITPSVTGDSDVTFSPSTLTFTTINWNTAQTVTVSAAEDGDTTDDSATIAHAVAGADYTAVVAANVAVTVTDNDTAGVTVSTPTLSVNEGGSDTYTVVLTSQPTAEVTITPSVTSDSDVTVSAALTFTATNWDTAQTVTVSAAEDADTTDDSATITHAVASTDADYTAVIAENVAVTVVDNEQPSALVSATVNGDQLVMTFSEPLDEDSVPAFTNFGVRTDDIRNRPRSVRISGTMVILTLLTPVKASTQVWVDYTLPGTNPLRDLAENLVETTHTCSGSPCIPNVRAINNTPVVAGVTVSGTALTIDEGSTGTYTVVLDTEPTADVTVTPSVPSDSDVTVSAALTFTATNWDTAQTVTVSAAEDADTTNDSATIAHTVASTGADYTAVIAANVAVTVADNDSADSTAPQVTSIARSSPATSPTNADSLSWRVTFSEAVQTVDAADFALSGSTATPAVSAVSASEYTVTASGGDLAEFNGTVTLSFATGQNIQDLAGNALANTTPTGANNADYALDNTAPTLAISGVPAISNAPFTATFTFSEDITGFVVGDISLVNARLSAFTTTSGAVYTALITPAANGSVTLDVAADVAQDAAGNGNSAATRASSSYTAPTVPTIRIFAGTSTVPEGTAASFTLIRSGAPITAPLTVTVTVSENGDVIATADEGVKQVTFEAGVASALLSVTTIDDAVVGDDSVVTATVVADTAVPATYTSIASAMVTVTDNDSAGVTVSTTDLLLAEGGTGTYTVVLTSQPTGEATVTPSSDNSDVTFSPAVLTFTASNWDTAQTLTVSAAEDADSADDSATITHAVAGADYALVSAEGMFVTVTVEDNDTADSTAPQVTSIARSSPATSPTNVDSLTWLVTFSEVVRNVDTADFALSGSTATLALQEFDGSAYIITASGGDLAGFNGTVTLSFAEDQNIQDTAGNALTNTTPTDTNNADYVIDNTAPTLVISGVQATSDAPFTATFTFSEGVEGFSLSDIVLGNATASDFTATSRAVYTALITPTANGVVTVDVAAGAAVDSVGNETMAATQVRSTYTAPIVATITIAAGTTPVTEGTAAAFTLSRSGATTAALTVAVTVTETGEMVAAANKGAQSVMFGTGAATASLSVMTLGDTTSEANSVVTATVAADTAGSATYTPGTPASATVTVADDDGGLLTLSITASSPSVTEGTDAVFVVRSSVPVISDLDVTVQVQASPTSQLTMPGGLSLSGATGTRVDIGPVRIPLGQSEATIRIPSGPVLQAVLGGVVSQGYLTATLVNTPAYGVGTPGFAEVRLDAMVHPADELPVVSLALQDTASAVTEGDTIEFVVSRPAPPAPLQVDDLLALEVNVRYHLSTDGVNDPVVDTVTLEAGTLEKIVTIPTPDNEVVDPSRVLTVALVSGTGYTIGDTASVTVTVTDNDSAGVTLSESDLSVDEGGSGTYTMVLTSQPTGAVTVTPSSNNSEVTVSPSTLTFTATDWSTAQTVTVSAAEDADAAQDSATIAHAVAGADYTAVIAADMPVTVTDNDSAGVTLSKSDLSVAEGGSDSYTIVLTSQPTAEVTVTPSVTGDSDVTVSAALTFTTDNWNTAQEVTVSAAQDDDTTDDSATVAHAVAGADYALVTAAEVSVTVTDNDSAGVTVSTPALSVDEGGTGSYTVVLNSQPTGQVTVTPSVTGDSDVTVSAALTFTTGNWDRAQTVTVSAAEDDDAENDSAAIAHGVAGADYASVRAANVVVTVTDNDTADSTAPRLVSIKRVLTSPTNADRLTWRVRFSEAVRDVDAVDFALSGTSATLMVISTSSVRDYIVTASGGDLAGLDGTASLSLAAVQNIQDLAGNALANTTPTGTSNADYAIDNTAPTLAISGVPATSDAPFTATFTFSEDITGFAVDDITPDNATLSAFTTTSATGYTARVTPIADGSVTLDVAADVAEDTAGNGNTAAARASSRYTASTLPVITISADTTPLTEGTAAAFTLSRTGATTTALTVNVMVTESGDVVAGDDEGARQITFTANSATASLTVATVADSLDEADSVVTATVADDSADPATYTPGSPATATATVTVEDNDTAGVTVSESDLSVDEGGSGSYTVVLTSQPTAEVTVTPSVTGDSDVTLSPATLTFTTGNWDTAQTVTVSAAEDADTTDDNATIIHSVAGGNYALVTAAAVAVTVTDNDTADSTAPRLVSIELVSPTNADRLWRVTFSEAVRNVDAADFALSVTTATLAQETSRKAAQTVLIALSGTTATLAQETSRIAAALIVRAISASEYIVTVRGDDLATLNGRVRVTLSLAMDQNIQDTAGNALVNTMPTGTNDASHEVDNTPPPQAPNRPATGAPVIEGALTMASVLTANTSQIRDADGLDGVVYRYQWLRIDGAENAAGNGSEGREIAGATEGRYRISEQDIGHRLRLRVAFADARGNPEQLYSAPTAAVSVVSREVTQAWLGRFGRTVSEQVLTVVDGRLHSSREAGSSLRLAGHELAQESADKAGYKPDDGWGWRVRDEAEEGLYGAYGGRGVSGREWLTGSSFNVTSGSEAGNHMAFWGGVAANRFSGQQDAVAIEGEVISGQMGADWRRRWGTAGLLLSHARGEGDYRVDDDSGTIESTLTGVYPFVGYTLNDRTSLWGVAGYGSGESRYRSAEGGGWYTSDLSLSLAAAGIRTVVRPTVAGSGLELSLVADGLLLRTESDASLGIAAESARVNRVRTGLEGRWHGLGSGLTPVLELGLRHDGGDVEKGFGADLGGGVDWHRGRFELQVRGRGLLTHEDSAFRNRGFSGMMSWQSQPSSSYGLKLRMQQSVGGSATGGVAALHGRETMAGLHVSGSSQESPLSSRTEMSVAYGMPFGRYFIGTPEVGLGITDQQQDYRVGWRLDLRRNREIDFALGLEVRRRENLETEDAGYEATLQLRANW